MDVRRFVATCRHDSTFVAALLVVAFITVEWQNIARAQFGRPANQRPAQGYGSANSLNPYGMPRIGGANSPYPIRDPTADERVLVAARVYLALLDEWTQMPGTRLDRHEQRRMLTPNPSSSSRNGWEYGRCAGRTRRTIRPKAAPHAIRPCLTTSGE